MIGLLASTARLMVSIVVFVQAIGAYASWSRPSVAFLMRPQPVFADQRMASIPSIPTQVAMRNVNFYVDPTVVLQIRWLRGTMTSKVGGPILFDDKRSFILHIAAAEVGLSSKDLSVLMNKYVFAYRGAPLKHLTVRTSGNEIVQSGLLHKGVNIPFEIHARMTVTPQGMIRLHPTRIKIFGINGHALMHALGLSLEKLIDLSQAHGVSVHGNDLFLDPGGILPPPTIDGHVTSVRIEGDDVVQIFGGGMSTRTAPRLIPPDTSARNFMYYKGGMLRFGRLLMFNAEMQIIDLNPEDPFNFNIDYYNTQLIAGYSRTLPDLGLEVYMRDIDKVHLHRDLPRP